MASVERAHALDLIPPEIPLPHGMTCGPVRFTRDLVDAALLNHPDGHEKNDKAFAMIVKELALSMRERTFNDDGYPVVIDSDGFPTLGLEKLLAIKESGNYELILNGIFGIDPESSFAAGDKVLLVPQAIVKPDRIYLPTDITQPAKLSLRQFERRDLHGIFTRLGISVDSYDKRLSPRVNDARVASDGLPLTGDVWAFDPSGRPVWGTERALASWHADRPLRTFVITGCQTERLKSFTNSNGHMMQARRAMKSYAFKGALELVARFDANDESLQLTGYGVRRVDCNNPTLQTSILSVDKTVWLVANIVSAAFHVLASRISRKHVQDFYLDIVTIAGHGQDAGVHAERATTRRLRAILALVKFLATNEKIIAEIKRSQGIEGDNKKHNKLNDTERSRYLRAFIVTWNLWIADQEAPDTIVIPAGPRYPRLYEA